MIYSNHNAGPVVAITPPIGTPIDLVEQALAQLKPAAPSGWDVAVWKPEPLVAIALVLGTAVGIGYFLGKVV